MKDGLSFTLYSPGLEFLEKKKKKEKTQDNFVRHFTLLHKNSYVYRERYEDI